MAKKIITLPTDDSKIYKQILAFMNFMLNATNQEREVLAELIRLNHEYEALPEDKRAKFILSTDMRKEVRELLGIQEKQFNTIISRLKGKKFMGKRVLSKEGIVHEELLFKPDSSGFKIEINLINQEKPKQEIEEPKQETVQEEAPKPTKQEEKKLAPPANGTDNIIEQYNEDDDFGITILPPNP